MIHARATATHMTTSHASPHAHIVVLIVLVVVVVHTASPSGVHILLMLIATSLLVIDTHFRQAIFESNC